MNQVFKASFNAIFMRFRGLLSKFFNREKAHGQSWADLVTMPPQFRPRPERDPYLMYFKLGFALIAIGLSLYGRQASSMSEPLVEVPVQSAPWASASPEVPPLKPIEGLFIDWEQRVIHALGKGFSAETSDPAVNRMLALRAARADALRKLALVVYSMHLDPLTTIEGYLSLQDETHKKMRLKIEGLIRGSQELGEAEYTSDGGVKLHLVLPLSGLEKGLGWAQPLPKQ